MSPDPGSLRRRITREGPVSVARYMEDALCHPQYGYYTNKDPFGVAGDFITAPETSQMFGELIGAWCVVVWRSMGEPKDIMLVEPGPGRATLMSDILRSTATSPDFTRALQVHMLEVSPKLRACQKKALKNTALKNKPVWHCEFAEIPQAPMILIANEFFDALPIEQFQRFQGNWHQRLIDIDKHGGFRFVLSEPMSEGPLINSDIHIFAQELPDVPEGSIIEICPGAIRLADDISQRIVRHGGAALVIDYGHGKSDFKDTLQAVKNHAFHDVLANPGEADITAHVDFAAMADAAVKAGANVHGPIYQGEFLQRLGIGARARALSAKATQKQLKDIQSAYSRLTDASQMGTLFKAMAITRLDMAAPPGFYQ